jgi:HEAT repeat protein
VKVLRKGVSVDRAVLERFTRGSPNRIHHPNLVSIELISETENGYVYYVMPMLRGDTLESLLVELRRGSSERPSLSPLAIGPDGDLHPEFVSQVAKLFSEAAQGLQVAHAEGVVHGRLSPRNLILTPAGRLVITDFGGDPSTGVGDDIVYRPPEQLDPFPEQIGQTADVYALGAIFFETLTRRPINEGLNPHELKDRIRARRFPTVQALNCAKTLPREIVACIHKAMALKPAERYESAGALSADLQRFLRHEEPLAARPTVRRRSFPRLVPRFAQFVPPRAVAAFALALLLGSAWLVGQLLLGSREGSGTLSSHDPGRAMELGGEKRYALHSSATSLRGEAPAGVDPLIADLLNSNPAAAHAALTRMALEIENGARPRGDARLAARVLWSRDPSVRRHAIQTVALCGHSAPLLNLLLVADKEPTVYLDGRTFFAFHDALERIGDEEAVGILCGWNLEECERLDRVARPAAAPLEPNLALELEENCPREFTARWIRVRAKFDPESLLNNAALLAEREELLPDLIAGLAVVGSAEAQNAIARLTREHTFGAGREAVKALASLGAHSQLLEIARGSLPVSVRETALEFLGHGFGGLYLPELEAMALTSPDPSIRTRAFRFLSTSDHPPTLSVITGALDDSKLKRLALLWLESIPADEAAPLLIELLGHRDAQTRKRAAEHLVSARRKDLVLPLARSLLSHQWKTRDAALMVLTRRNELTLIPEALSCILGDEPAPPSTASNTFENFTASLEKIWARFQLGYMAEFADNWRVGELQARRE